MEYRKRRCGEARTWLVCLLLVSLAACGGPDPETELDEAEASFAAGDYKDAALRLRYVVQQQPDNIRARELRADIGLRLGDYTNAASEYERILELGAPVDSVALRLAETWIAQGLAEEALELLDAAEDGKADDPLYWTLRAEALLAADRLPEAERSLDEVRKFGDLGARALTIQAKLAFAYGDLTRAFNSVELALAVAPDDPQVRMVHAELLARSNQLEQAAAELQQAADLFNAAGLGPREVVSLLGLVQIHLARNDLLAAEEAAARLAKQAPNMQWTSYLQGLVKFRRGQFDEAAAQIQPLVNAFPDSIQYRSLLGAIQLALGNFGQAEQHFLRALAESPRDPSVAKLLAETRLRQQRPDAALDALSAVQDSAADDPQIGLLSGLATVASGKPEQGVRYLEQAAALDPGNEMVKLQLARTYVAMGRDADASKLLADALGDGTSAIEGTLLRLLAERRQGNEDAAAEIAEQLVTDYPENARALAAAAVHFQLSGKPERARELFEKAVEFDTEDATAQLLYASSLVQEGRLDEAEGLLRKAIARQPENAQALAGLGQLLAGRGATNEAAELFSRAAEHSTSVIPRLALVQMQLREGQYAEARQQLETAAATAPGNPQVIALSGILALAEGEAGEAVALLERAASSLPDRLDIALALGRAQLANRQPEAARSTLGRALDLAPRSYQIRLALGDAELQSGNAERALSIATDLKVDFPSQAGGYLLEGRSLIASRQYSAASKSLATAFERQSTWPVLALRIQALRLAGRSDEAIDASAAWLAENPSHVPAGLLRAELLMAAERMEEALEAYGNVLQADSGNLVALNNAAWIAQQLGEPEALSFAERAYAVGPDNASVLDTYGWILLDRGDSESAVSHLSRAAELAPQSPGIRYHLAAALAADGQSVRAREILDTLLRETRDFDQRAEAEQLLKSMQPEVAVNE